MDINTEISNLALIKMMGFQICRSEENKVEMAVIVVVTLIDFGFSMQ